MSNRNFDPNDILSPLAKTCQKNKAINKMNKVEFLTESVDSPTKNNNKSALNETLKFRRGNTNKNLYS